MMEEETNEEYTDEDVGVDETRVPNESPQYDRVIQEKKVGNFIAQTSPTNTLTKIDWMLKGFIYDEVKQGWHKIAQGIPDQIRLNFLQALSPHLTEDVRMTRLDATQINNIMAFVIEWTVDNLDILAEEEAIKKKIKNNKLNDFDIHFEFNTETWRWEVNEVEAYTKYKNLLKEIEREKLNIIDSDMTKICLIIWSAVFYSISRAINGVERDKMYNALKLGDNLNDYAKEDSKKGIIESFLSWK